MALLIRQPRWRPGVGKRVGTGVLLAPQMARDDHGRCVALTVLTASARFTLKIPERQAGDIARRILEIGGVLPDPARASPAQQTALQLVPDKEAS